MNKSELVREIAKESGVTIPVAVQCLDAFTNEVTKTLKHKQSVTLVGFGTFEVRHRVERQGKNPRTGEPITVPAQNTPAFRAGKLLKATVK